MADSLGRLPVLAGHPFAPIGRGEDIRCAYRAFKAIGTNISVRDIYGSEAKSDIDLAREMQGNLVHALSQSVNIFYINGDEAELVFGHIKNELPPEAYNIVVPAWELSNYPREWAEQLDLFNEVWAMSEFVLEAVQKSVSRPVFHMSSPVQFNLSSFLGRKYFGLPESSYLFLFFFDFRSYVDRKNPFAVLKAFEKAYEQRPQEDIGLVIKINRPDDSASNTNFQKFMRVIDQCACRDRIIIIDRLFTDNEIKNLIRCCDCFISLHRSEGLGRGMAEAMYLGKPVIATGYSGNLDFMDEQNSCLVDYKLIEVKNGQYPHAKGQVWADASIDHAVKYMLKLLDDRDWGRALGRIARGDMQVHFNYKITGLKYKERLDKISSGPRQEQVGKMGGADDGFCLLCPES